jgi:hypothetical protein
LTFGFTDELGVNLSTAERKENGSIKDDNFVYGEVGATALASVFRLIQKRYNCF